MAFFALCSCFIVGWIFMIDFFLCSIERAFFIICCCHTFYGSEKRRKFCNHHVMETRRRVDCFLWNEISRWDQFHYRPFCAVIDLSGAWASLDIFFHWLSTQHVLCLLIARRDIVWGVRVGGPCVLIKGVKNHVIYFLSTISLCFASFCLFSKA